MVRYYFKYKLFKIIHSHEIGQYSPWSRTAFGSKQATVALQKAKLEFIQKSSKEDRLPYNRLPYNRAAIRIAGKTDAIEIDKMNPWIDLAIIVALAGLSFWVWQKWGKK